MTLLIAILLIKGFGFGWWWYIIAWYVWLIHSIFHLDPAGSGK